MGLSLQLTETKTQRTNSRAPKPSGVERTFGDHELIVSKTDLKGRITYANDVFLRLADYPQSDVLGAPHNLIRHPDMPRCVFKLLWDTLPTGREIFAYIVNMSGLGHHYWVFAHVTPSFGPSGDIVGYHSNRRVPNREILTQTIIPLYRRLLEEEERHSSRKAGMAASSAMLLEFLKDKGVSYEEFILAN